MSLSSFLAACAAEHEDATTLYVREETSLAHAYDVPDAPPHKFVPANMESYDLETHAIQRGLLAPPIVCASVATFEPGTERVIVGAQAALDELERILRADAILTGANVPYDLGCALAADFPRFVGLVFDKLERGQVYDVLIGEALDAIAGGHLFMEPRTLLPLKNSKGKKTERYSLDIVVRLELGRDNAKENDFWRVRYAMLEHVPFHFWPTDAAQYPCDDARNTVDSALAQLSKHRNLHNMPEQVYTAFCLHLGAMWGLRTDAERVHALEERVAREQMVLNAKKRALGFLRDDNSENKTNLKRHVARAYGATSPCEECEGTGQVPKVERNACRGEKPKGRYLGCLCTDGTTHCPTCNDTGEVERVTKTLVACKLCDGTGLDLDEAPTLPRTKTGISCDRDTLLESGDDELESIAYNEVNKIAQTYLPFLREGLDAPITLSPNVLVESGRTSYNGLIQLMPRGWGVRACFVARPGYVYGSCDYAALELCTLAQICLWICGYSKMAEAINATGKPGVLHGNLGARLLGLSKEEFFARLTAGDKACKRARQASKPVNFGLPGGMGAAKLVLTSRKPNTGETVAPDGKVYPGIRFCILLGGAERCGAEKVTSWGRQKNLPPICKHCVQIAQDILKPAWLEEYPEMREYFDWVNYQVRMGGDIECFVSRRVRSVANALSPFCAGANNGFQALAGDGAKNALRKVTRESYLVEESDLYGTRPIFFAHDEIVAEHPEEIAHLACTRMARLMEEAMREYVPDVVCRVEPTIMKHWYKDAEPVYDASGKLILWTPKE